MTVSICIPTYKQIESLKRCLDSILIQTFLDYEIIITDDTPTDEVKHFVEGYNFHEKSIVYLQNKTRLGSPGNWNEGIKHAKGKYIKVLHHDDWFTYPDSLDFLVNTLENNPNAYIGFVGSRHIDLKTNHVFGTNSPTPASIKIIEKYPILLACGNYIGSPSATIFRKLDATYFDTNLKWYVDAESYSNILVHQKNVLGFNPIDAISIGVGDSQISRECENDAKINIYEFFYYLNKYRENTLKHRQITNIILKHFNRFDINSLADIKKYYKGPLPKRIGMLLFLKKHLGIDKTNKLVTNSFFNKFLYRILLE